VPRALRLCPEGVLPRGKGSRAGYSDRDGAKARSALSRLHRGRRRPAALRPAGDRDAGGSWPRRVPGLRHDQQAGQEEVLSPGRPALCTL
jgi:hypothetical protein